MKLNFDTIPARIVQRIQTAPTDLRDAAEALGLHYHSVDLGPYHQADARLAALAAALGFPGYFGGNLDALYDCLTDLPGGQLIVLHGIPKSKDGEALLGVLRDAAGYFEEQDESFRVLYD